MSGEWYWRESTIADLQSRICPDFVGEQVVICGRVVPLEHANTIGRLLQFKVEQVSAEVAKRKVERLRLIEVEAGKAARIEALRKELAELEGTR